MRISKHSFSLFTSANQHEQR